VERFPGQVFQLLPGVPGHNQQGRRCFVGFRNAAFHVVEVFRALGGSLL
jgi:hypothetical protein